MRHHRTDTPSSWPGHHCRFSRHGRTVYKQPAVPPGLQGMAQPHAMAGPLGDDRADDWDDWNDPDDTDRSPGSSQIKTVSDPSYAQARKLDVDIDKGVIRVLEKEGISQIQVNVQDTYNRTQCYMDEFTLKVKRESGRSRGNEAPRIEILIPAGYGLDKLSLDLAPRSARSLVSLSPNWRLTQELAPLHFQALSTGMWKSRQGWEM